MQSPARENLIPLVVVMGVSGSGKSTIGEAVAHQFGIDFIDGDDLHPTSNVRKMKAGQPLDDTDRWPWLATVGRVLTNARDNGLIVACSALKRSYRDAILLEAPDAVFLHLDESREVLSNRLKSRSGHFMPAALLDSQLEDLERLQEDEPGIAIDANGSVDEVVAAALKGIRLLFRETAER